MMLPNQFTKLFFTFLFAIAFSFSCSQRPETTSTSLRLSGMNSGHMALSNLSIMIYGVRSGGEESFGRSYNGNPLELTNGSWQFLIISWEGQALHTQSIFRCGRSSANLVGGDQVIDVSLSQIQCAHSDFGPVDSKNPSTAAPLPIEFSTVLQEECLDRPNEPYCYRGVSRSYRVTLNEFTNNQVASAGLTSLCTNHTEDTNSRISTTNFPIFVLNNGLNIPVRITAFHGANCEGTNESFLFPRGFLSNLPGKRGKIDWAESGLGANTVTLRTNPCLKTDGSPFTFSTTSFPENQHIICRPEELSNYSPTYQNDTFIIGKNLNFSGIPFQPLPIFWGTFDGRGHTLSNLTITSNAPGQGFFSNLGDGDNNPVVVKNLKLDGVVANANHPNFGLIAGYAANNVHLDNITISNSVVNVSGADLGGYGVFVGNAMTSEPGTQNRFMNLKSLNNRIHVNGPGLHRIGGVAGYINNVTPGLPPALFENIHVDSFRVVIDETNADVEKIGGVIGEASPAYLSDISVTNLRFNETMDYPFFPYQNLGGIVGVFREDSRLSNARAQGQIAPSTGCLNSICAANVGGLIGMIEGSLYHIDNVINHVQISAPTMAYAGGIAGRVMGGAPIAYARNLAPIFARGYVGGIAGHVNLIATDELYLHSSYNKGNITSVDDGAGGIVGHYSAPFPNLVTKVFSTGDITAGLYYAGGIFGYNSLGGVLTSAYAMGNISAENYAAGIVGGQYDLTNGDDLSDVFSLVNSVIVNEAPFTYDTVANRLGGEEPINCYFLGSIDGGATGNGCENLDSATVMVTNSDDWIDLNNMPRLKFSEAMELLAEEKLGSLNDPILLSQVNHWNAIGDNPFMMTRSFMLSNDLNFSGQNFTPWGSDINPFQGVLMGNNRTIRNIIYEGDDLNIGLITEIRPNSSLSGNVSGIYHPDKNAPNGMRYLFLENNHFENISGGTTETIGTLVGYVHDDDVTNKAVIIEGVKAFSGIVGAVNSLTAGGLIGQAVLNQGNSRFTHLSGNINFMGCPSYEAGGLIGDIASSSGSGVYIDSLVSTGSVNCSSTSEVGGVIGRATSIDMEKIVYKGTQSSVIRGEVVGGLIGNFTGPGQLGTSLVTGGSIEGDLVAGGLVGSVYNATINGTYAAMAMIDASTIGTLVGRAITGATSYVQNSYSLTPDETSLIGDISGAFCSSLYSVNGTLGTEACGLEGDSVYISLPMLRDPAQNSLMEYDPWIFSGSDRPRIFYEVLPEYSFY